MKSSSPIASFSVCFIARLCYLLWHSIWTYPLLCRPYIYLSSDLFTLLPLKWGMTRHKLRNWGCPWGLIQTRMALHKMCTSEVKMKLRIVRQVLYTFSTYLHGNWTCENHLFKKKFKKALHDIIWKGAVHMHLKPKTEMQAYSISCDAHTNQCQSSHLKF